MKLLLAIVWDKNLWGIKRSVSAEISTLKYNENLRLRAWNRSKYIVVPFCVLFSLIGPQNQLDREGATSLSLKSLLGLDA